LVTLTTTSDCLTGGRVLSGDPSKGFRHDQPIGGYATTSN